MPKISASLAIFLALCAACSARDAQLPALLKISVDLTYKRLDDLCAKAAIPNDTTAEISQLVAAISDPGLVDTLGNSPALYAVMADDAAQLDRLLELGYDTSIPDGSLLHAAAFWNSVNSADRLLDKGIDPNVKNSGGGTPLMVAISEGGPDVAKLLLARGAHADNRALRYAMVCKDQSMVNFLVDAGAPIDADTRRLADKHGIHLSADER